MTLDTNDLRVLLGDHAATVTSVPDFATSAATGGRRIQRRRATSVVVAAGMVVAAILGITQLGSGSHRSAVPATPKGFAMYSNGMKLVKGEQGASPLTFDVTLPATADGKPVAVGVSLSCAAPQADENHLGPEMNLSINGVQQGGVTGCYKAFPAMSSVTISWNPKDQAYAPGSTLHVAVALSGKTPPAAQLRVGVYSAVPLDQYVFPPRPAHLTTIEHADASPPGKVLGTIKAGGPTSLVVRPKKGLSFSSTSTEPGHLEILVNGKVVDSVNSWSYDEQSSFNVTLSVKQLGVSAGQRVRVTVVPTRYTGEHTWAVSITDRATN